MANDLSGTENAKFRTNRTLICSVVFLDIVEYSKKPVDSQMRLKERFNAILAESLKDIPVVDRIILDTGDGAAIGFLSDPEDALFVAMSIRDALNIEQEKTDLLVRMGINLGPVKILKDINNQMNLIGDGINVAQRIMSFAEPGQLLVSRSYYDIVSCLSQEYAQLFQYKGAKADKHVREHDIYSVENTGLRPSSTLHSSGNPIKPEADKIESITAAETETPITPVATQKPDTGSQKRAGKNILFIAVPVVVVLLIIALVFLIPKMQDKSPSSATITKSQAKAAKVAARAAKKAEEKEKAEAEATRIPEKKAEEKNGGRENTVRSASVKADDIEFTLTGINRAGEAITVSVRIRNSASMAKSVALYDDYVRWPKSKLTDQTGKICEVNKVLFQKGSQSITSQAAGTQGLSLSPNETANVTLTFNKTGKGIKNFTLHPFIYMGRSWKEHDLPLKTGT
jgi:hypothetical protein